MSIYYTINLEEIFNHKAFLESNVICPPNNIEAKGVGVTKVFFNSSCYQQKDPTIIINEVPFIFPALKYDKYDNVMCSSQIINISRQEYSRIHVIGFSGYADIEDNIKLIFNDNHEENIAISIMCWNIAGYTNQTTGINIIKDMLIDKNCKSVLLGKSTRSCNVACTYYKSDIITAGKQLTSIQLPDNAILNILALTLEK